MHVHSARNFKKERFFRNEKILSWERIYCESMVPEGWEMAKKILMEHPFPAIDRSIIERNDKLISDYEKSSV